MNFSDFDMILILSLSIFTVTLVVAVLAARQMALEREMRKHIDTIYDTLLHTTGVCSEDEIVEESTDA